MTSVPGAVHWKEAGLVVITPVLRMPSGDQTANKAKACVHRIQISHLTTPTTDWVNRVVVTCCMARGVAETMVVPCSCGMKGMKPLMICKGSRRNVHTHDSASVD